MSDKERTFDEILGPFRKEVEESGLTDEELYALLEDERNQMHEERRWKEAEENGFPTLKELLDTLTHCRRTIPSESGPHFFNLDLIRQIVRCHYAQNTRDDRAMKWISVKDRLPEKNTTVLVAGGQYVTVADWYVKDG